MYMYMCMYFHIKFCMCMDTAMDISRFTCTPSFHKLGTPLIGTKSLLNNSVMPVAVSLALLLLTSCSVNMVSGKAYFIIPSIDGENGPYKVNHGDTCVTLSQFADNPAQFVGPSSLNSLHFLPGKHYLETELKLANVQGFEMLSSQANSPKPVIVCGKSSRFSFNKFDHLLISDLEFRGCAFTIADSNDRQEIINTTFIGSENSGTVLTVSHSNLTVMNSSFISNTIGSKHADPILPLSEGERLDSTYVGGAIVATRESNVGINDCTFNENSAPLGGAIFAEQSSQVMISRSRFTGIGQHNNINNGIATARGNISLTVLLNHGSGGAVFLHNSSLAAYQCDFLEHSAQRGGVIFAYKSVVSLSECNFTSNVAGYNQNTGVANPLPSAGTVPAGYGGALYTLQNELSINGCVFTGNEAYNRGGVIYAENGSVILHNSNFSYNIANLFGGVVFTNNAILNVNKSTLSHNMANDTGGAIYASFRKSTSAVVSDNVVTLYESTLSNNSANLCAGALYSYDAFLNATRNNFTANSVTLNGKGGAMTIQQGTARVTDCNFTHNQATNGGSISTIDNFIVIVENSTFAFNNATNDAGGITGAQNTVMLRNSNFISNTAKWAGAIAAYENSTITVEKCTFTNNRAIWGGALASYQGTLIMNSSVLMHQEATKEGGAVYSHESSLIIDKCKVSNNTAMKRGGALAGVGARLSIVHGSDFHNNEAKYYGSVIHWTNGAIHTSGETTIKFYMNTALKGVIYLYDTTADFTGNTTFKHNRGSLYTVSSHVTFSGVTIFENCSSDPSPEEPATTKRATAMEISRLEGGALTITFESTITFNGQCSFINNHAKVGGGFIVTESKVYLNGETVIADNKATDTGGGIYLYQSELNCKVECNLLVHNNAAAMRGGGVHAFSSLVKVTNPQSTIYFTKNRAGMGGGVCLEMDTKIYILKTDANSTNAIGFVSNSAETDGGGIHVIDGPHSCASTNILPYVTNECFLQTIEQYTIQPSYMISEPVDSSIFTSMNNLVHFFNNTAKSGPGIYGGLISSCTISKSNIAQNHPHPESGLSPTTIAMVNGTSYIGSISNIQLTSISSDPIRICSCRDGWPDCNYQPCPIRTMKGESFTVSVAAVDQAHQPVPATVYSYFQSTENDLMKQIFTINKDGNSVCTDLKFTRTSPGNSSDELILHVEGPCKDAELSKLRFDIDFYSCVECPIGFESQTTSAKCECTCDSSLKALAAITICNSSTGIIQRENNFWLTYLNNSGYLFYKYCPMDYCKPPIAELNLNIPSGSDAQCAFDRTGLLCGSCQPGLSLSLGSSKCLSCQEHWLAFPLITLGAILAGIVLCILILVLNLTVAEGTINGVIFYANVIAASYSTFLPNPLPNFASVFISLLNFDLGLDVCYLNGMDSYIRTWLQLAFPLYVFVLVLVVIKVSQYSSRFAILIGKKNPVATLSTLILLSYTKILSTTVSVLSFATLHYPNGSVRYVWRPDASVEYLKGKHIPLFIIATIVLLLGFAYTMLLFSWQWILYGQQWKILNKWTRNCTCKLNSFMETYHAPFNGKHRYWVGLLLIVRSALYLVAATNFSGNPRIVLTSTAFMIGFLLFLKASIALRVYKKRIIDFMETFLYFNIIVLCTFIWFTLDAEREQAPVAYLSIIITFTQFLGIIAYIIIKEICKKMKSMLHIQHNNKQNNVEQLGDHEDMDVFLEYVDADDRRGNVGYQLIQIPRPSISHVTQSTEISNIGSTSQHQCETYAQQDLLK